MREGAFSGDFKISETPEYVFESDTTVSEGETLSDVDGGSKDTFREHLDSSFEPIVTCVGTDYEHADHLPEKIKIIFDPLLAREKGVYGNTTEMLSKLGVDNIDYSATDEEKKRYQMISPGPSEYVMSRISSSDKYSEGFYNCFGMVVVGQDKYSGENTSFVLHCPLYDVSDKLDLPSLFQMKTDINTRLNEMKERCVPESIDATIMGGSDDEIEFSKDKNYGLLNFLGSEVNTVLNFRPVFVAGVKRRNLSHVTFGSDAIFFESKTRRIFLIRPEYMEGKSQLNKKV